MPDYSLVAEYDYKYQEAYYAWSPFYPLADLDLRMYLGDQWDNQEKQKLFDENRNAFVSNFIRKNINLVLGYQIQHQLSPSVVARENSDLQGAADLTDLALYGFDYGEGYRYLSLAFGGCLKSGFNLLNLWKDYRDDPINGDIRFGRDPYCGFITDPYFTKLDFSDCGYVIKRRYLNVEQAASLLPGMEKEVYKLHSFGWSRDDKFTWLPYQIQPNGSELIAYNEFYQQKWKQVPAIVDMETGEFTEWEGSREALKYFLEKFPQLKEVKRPKRYIELNIILNDEHMKTEINPFGLSEYPFVPMIPIFEPESANWELKVQSLVRPQVDPQKESNRRRSQLVDIVDSQINSGWIAEQGAVVNPRSLFQTSQGKVIWKHSGMAPDAISKIPPTQLPQGLFELQRQFDADVLSVIGMNEASFGMTQNDQESGIMMMLRQGASLVNLQDVFEMVRHAQKLAVRKMLLMMQSWFPGKVERILGRKPSEQFYTKEFIKYDVTLAEGTLSSTQQQMYFRQLVELQQLGAPVTGKMLAEAAPIQMKGQYLKDLQESEQQQQQQAQAAQELQSKLIDSQTQAQTAKAISDVALSKERFTRAVANIGLEEERNSRAVDDRASAALDRARAMKELASMDDERLLKYLGIVRAMEEMNKSQEEKIKQEDVGIAAQGQQIGNQLVGMSQREGESVPV